MSSYQFLLSLAPSLVFTEQYNASMVCAANFVFCFCFYCIMGKRVSELYLHLHQSIDH